MKKSFVFAALFSMILLSACNDNDDPQKSPTLLKIEETLNTRDTEIDLAAFLETAQKGVWKYDDICFFYTNGDMADEWTGGAPVNYMSFQPNGKAKVFYWQDFNPLLSKYHYNEIEWSVDPERPNTIELYSPYTEKTIKEWTSKGVKCDYAARTTMELLYYQNGVFVMKGLQPYCHSGAAVDAGIYYDYCLFLGHIDTDEATVNEYQSYPSIEELTNN